MLASLLNQHFENSLLIVIINIVPRFQYNAPLETTVFAVKPMVVGITPRHN